MYVYKKLQFSGMVAPFHIPMSMTIRLGVVCVCNVSHSCRCTWLPHSGFTLHFLITNNVEHLAFFHVSSFVKCLFKPFTHLSLDCLSLHY